MSLRCGGGGLGLTMLLVGALYFYQSHVGRTGASEMANSCASPTTL